MVKAGVPAAMVTTSAFHTLADNERRAKGVPDLPLLLIDHPLGGERIEGVTARAAQAVQALADAIARADRP
jgi:predicted Zn-dependent protease